MKISKYCFTFYSFFSIIKYMKKGIIKLIKLYQKVPGNFHNYCRFYPTCSNYAIEAIEEYGLIKGGFKSLVRIIRCNPFCKCGYDPVRKGHKCEKDY